MNNQIPFMYPNNNYGDIETRLNNLESETRRIEHRLINIEKRLIPYKPVPSNNNNNNNDNYTTDNYII